METEEREVKEYCTKCGEQYEIGSWPWCPHEDAKNFGEDPLEPYIDEHITDEHPGVLITSRAQRRKIMDRNGLDYKKHVETPIGHKLYFLT